jgi:hypothetical protein
VVLVVLGVSLLAPMGCGHSAVALAPRAQVKSEDYMAVPFPPRPALVEMVPPKPRSDAVWVDGSWDWDGDRYRWVAGGWVIVPEGVRFARWVIVRRGDGQLFFAPSVWRNANGKVVAAPAALARAKTTSGGAAGAVEE